MSDENRWQQLVSNITDTELYELSRSLPPVSGPWEPCGDGCRRPASAPFCRALQFDAWILYSPTLQKFAGSAWAPDGTVILELKDSLFDTQQEAREAVDCEMRAAGWRLA